MQEQLKATRSIALIQLDEDIVVILKRAGEDGLCCDCVWESVCDDNDDDGECIEKGGVEGNL